MELACPRPTPSSRRQHLLPLTPNLPLPCLPPSPHQEQLPPHASAQTFRKNRSLQNIGENSRVGLSCRSQAVQEKQHRLGLDEKRQQELYRIQAEIAELSPESEVQEEPYLRKQPRQTREAQPLQLICLPVPVTLQAPVVQNTGNPGFTIKMCPLDPHPTPEEEPTDAQDILDRQFSRLLENNCSEQLNLEIQSKFTSAKPKSRELNLFQRESLQTHEQLLEEENNYMRDQLMQFTQMLQQDKIKLDQAKHKNRLLRKENVRLREEVEGMTMTETERLKVLQKYEEQCQSLSQVNQQQIAVIDKLQDENRQLQMRLEFVEKQYEQLEDRLLQVEADRDREIDQLIQEKQKMKELLNEDILEKDRIIQELNDYLHAMRKRKIQSELEHENECKTNRKTSIEGGDDEERQETSSSICLSLAEAQSLKNIIEQKEQQHIHQLLQLQAQIDDQQQTILKLQKQVYLTPEHPSFISSCHDQTEPAEQELLLLNSQRKSKLLQKLLYEEREEKMRLTMVIQRLQAQCLSAVKEEDEELDDLLESCLDELEKERAVSSNLRQEIGLLRRSTDNSMSA